MKRFYPEARRRAVIGAIDPDYVEAFLDAARCTGQLHQPKVDIGDGLRSYVFYPRGWMLLREHPDGADG